jgi:hypothetical protein
MIRIRGSNSSQPCDRVRIYHGVLPGALRNAGRTSLAGTHAIARDYGVSTERCIDPQMFLGTEPMNYLVALPRFANPLAGGAEAPMAPDPSRNQPDSSSSGS